MLYTEIGGDYKSFALPSMYNYLYGVLSALREQSIEEFKETRLAEYRGNISRTTPLTNENKQFIFEQLFFSYKLMNNLKRMSNLPSTERIPLIQVAGISFYYAIYSLANCFTYAHNKNILKTHSKTCHNYTLYCEELAFPFNLTGKYTDSSNDSEFQIIKGADEYTDVTPLSRPLIIPSLTEIDSKSAIFSYLKGTNRWYWENSVQLQNAIKEVKRDLDKDNFRTTASKAIRENHYQQLKESNFLHCLYRLRGKVNYRDSLFSLYGISQGMEFNHYEKSDRIMGLMLNVLEYFSVDIESYLIAKFQGMNTFHEELINDVLAETNTFSLAYPLFQKNLFHPADTLNNNS